MTIPCLSDLARNAIRSRAEAGAAHGEHPSATQRECRAMARNVLHPGMRLSTREAHEVDAIVEEANAPRMTVLPAGIETTVYQAPDVRHLSAPVDHGPMLARIEALLRMIVALLMGQRHDAPATQALSQWHQVPNMPNTGIVVRQPTSIARLS